MGLSASPEVIKGILDDKSIQGTAIAGLLRALEKPRPGEVWSG